MRVLVTTAPLHGHFFPLVPVSWALRAAGHEVLVAAPANFVEEIAATGLPVAPSAGAVEFADFMFHDRDGRRLDQPSDPAQRRQSSGRAWGRLAARTLDGTHDLVHTWRPDLVIGEPTEFAGAVAAATAGIPWVEHSWGLAVQPEYRPAAAVELRGECARYGLAGLPEPALRIDVCPPSVQRPGTPAGQRMRYVPFNGPAVLPDWARTPARETRICLTLGSMLPRHGLLDFAGMLRDWATALTRLGAEVVVGVADEVARSWSDLPPRVRATGWLPLHLVLPSCAAVVHHGGPGSLFTALALGVPQLALPQTADQFENADRMVAAGAGLRLLPAERTTDAVVTACRDLLAESRYRKNAELIAEENAAGPGPAEVVGVLERLVTASPWKEMA
ncbi:nucleotide disphospho-sugar-binding domain-containing protein [Micromonospora sp. NPDC050980]|uniref:nucleotide disphospho-sugar-binding domain-containing protein n=1 Tax=Micromonospora sp. NPDC050980 TaxID=3155161 RepID=UPI0033F30D46